MTPEKLPPPRLCPCCAGALEHTTRTVETIGRRGFAGRGPNRPFTKFKRPVHICRWCKITVMVCRVPRELAS